MELEIYKKSDFYEDYISSQKEYYERENADAYFAERLAEKDKKIDLLKEHICNGDVSRLTWIDNCLDKDKEIAELKQKLENVQASMYADVVDANMEVRRLKRALYKACANWADVVVFEETEGIGHDNSVAERWRKMESKCLAKAKEYR